MVHTLDAHGSDAAVQTGVVQVVEEGLVVLLSWVGAGFRRCRVGACCDEGEGESRNGIEG